MSLTPSRERNTQERGADHRLRFEAGFRDKFYGVEVLGKPSRRATCEACGAEMGFLAQFMEGDMNGLEDWYIAVLKICPKGHDASLQMERG